MKQRQESVKIRFIKLLSISEDDYRMLHYELAFGWFRYHDYFEEVARMFLFSKTYHSWWNHTLVMIEEVILHDYEDSDTEIRNIKDLYVNMALALNYRPNPTLALKFREEGEEAMRRKPSLRKMKIYR